MIDANINIITGETIYLSHGSFSDHTIHPYIALFEFNMKDALIEMIKEATTENEAPGIIIIQYGTTGSFVLEENTPVDTIIHEFTSRNHDIQYDFIAHLIQKGYIISPKQRIINLGGDESFLITEENRNPEQEKEDAKAQEEYEQMMNYSK